MSADSLSFVDWINVAAIVTGPLAAVLITRWLAKKDRQTERQLQVFRTLMQTRATPLSPDRVSALNLVEVEFASSNGVMKRFRELMNTYNDAHRWNSENPRTRDALFEEVSERTADLLLEMARLLGHGLLSEGIAKSSYYPTAFKFREDQDSAIREFFSGLNNGTRVLPTLIVAPDAGKQEVTSELDDVQGDGKGNA